MDLLKHKGLQRPKDQIYTVYQGKINASPFHTFFFINETKNSKKRTLAFLPKLATWSNSLFLAQKKTQWHLSVFPLSVCLSSLDVLLTSQPMDTASRPTAMPGHRYTPPSGPPLDTLVLESEVDSQGVWDLTVTSVGYSQSFSSVSSRLKLIIINRFIF